ncbi:hypothetical protein PIROE2DRAFT_2628 [Piromyces sp. E2]|nr:hypothetical protein PIROE2DRAFT_2628 [Piromyces sp. E2]|eukprot:OUM69535.1 hypothetical protein PIROE2DRAFT_2628 [Piromyces sp. E2]
MINKEHKLIKTREVIHLQFIAWPDHDEPNSITSFIDLIKLSKEIKSKIKNSDQYTDLEKQSLTVVHCSAGDPCLANIKLNSIDKIQECIVNLRKQRVMMVQSLQQLAFCYKALAYELIKFQLKE